MSHATTPQPIRRHSDGKTYDTVVVVVYLHSLTTCAQTASHRSLCERRRRVSLSFLRAVAKINDAGVAALMCLFAQPRKDAPTLRRLAISTFETFLYDRVASCSSRCVTVRQARVDMKYMCTWKHAKYMFYVHVYCILLYVCILFLYTKYAYARKVHYPNL